MRKLVTIQRIRKIDPIEGADRIELAHVKGWQCVVNKGKFQPGKFCVYFEIDSFLPVRPEFEFLRASSYKNSPLLGEGFRLKTMKFKGQISQGLVLPLDEVGIHMKEFYMNPVFPDSYYFTQPDGSVLPFEKALNVNPVPYTIEDLDVTQLLGVREWEIPERATTGGTIKGNLPYCIHKTDETRIQSMPELLEEFRGLQYYITTKYDGSSHSIAIDDNGEFHVTGHNFEYKDDGTSTFYEFVKKNGFEEKLRTYLAGSDIHSITVQGEWCGAGIQKNRLGLKNPDWFVFTIDVNGKRVGLDELFAICDACGFHHVDCQEVGMDLPSVYPTIDDLLKRAEDTSKTDAYGGRQPEGIVIRPTVPVYSKVLGGNLSMKVINNKYLLKTE